ncbi:hypothetical protein ACVNIS_24880 (plasmid) [Sphaerotilaceae bacterium SBD11-9]
MTDEQAQLAAAAASSSRRGVRLALLVSAALCAGNAATAKVSQPVQSSPIECRDAAVESAATPAELRALVDACRASSHVAMAALAKLNTTELPVPTERLAPAAAGNADQGVTLQANLYFGTGETYPTEEGFAALAALVKRLNALGAAVDGVVILGTVDAREAATPLARDIARGRAEAARRYLVAAGFQSSLVRVALRLKPASSAAKDGSSEDRAAGVAVAARAAGAVKAAAPGGDRQAPR